MRKGKGKEKKSRVVVAEQYEKDEGSSDDEMPEVVSNAAMKSNHELLNKELQHLKQQLRHTEKAKRRQKQELFIAQKKSKQSHSAEISVDEGPQIDSDKNSEAVVPSQKQQTKVVKKVYSSLNITVEPLTKIQDSRASAALDFKTRRLAKVPRESVKKAVISYQKKLSVRK